MQDVITKRISLQSSAVATGNGTAMNVTGFDHVLVSIEGISGDTITFEVTENESDWYAVKTTNMTTGASATTATADGLYIASILGTVKFRARVSTYGSGTIIVNARAARGDAGGGGGGVSDTELGAATVLADNTATPTAPFVGSFGMLYDGSTWDMARGDATNGMKVYPGAYATDDSAMPATPVIFPVAGEYRSSATTYTDGDATVLQSDVNGLLKTREGYAPGYEDNTNGVAGVAHKPVVSSTYSGTAFTDLGALAKDNEKATPAQLLAIHAQNENAAVRYLQIFNLAADPTDDSSVPVLSFVIPAGSGTAPGITSIGRDFFGESGYYLSTGFSWGISVDPDVFDETGVTVGEHQVNGLYI